MKLTRLGTNKSFRLVFQYVVREMSGTNESEVIIDVEVQEQPTGNLVFGAGYSSASGFGID